MDYEESWEREAKEDIDYCLNCTLPVELCLGYGKCTQAHGIRKRRRQGQLADEIEILVKKETKRGKIARLLNIRYSNVDTTIRYLVATGRISQEQANKTYSYKRSKK